MIKTTIRFSGIILLFLCPSLLLAAPGTDYGKTEILRDQWGIPHVFSETDQGAFYGLGYAQAKDRAFQMYYSLRIIQGRTAEILGEIPKQKRGTTSVTHDVKYRTLGFYRYAQRVAKNLDEESLALLNAFSQGVNDYIKENQDELLYLFEEYGLEPEPWTPADCLASWWHMGKFFSGEGLHDTMRYHRIIDQKRRERADQDQTASAQRRGDARRRENAQSRVRPQQRERMEELRERMENYKPPVDDDAAVVQREDVSEEWIKEVKQFVEEKSQSVTPDNKDGEIKPKFSHAWVVGGKKTTSKSSVLVSDPQTPVRNPSFLYEFHIKGKTFNARGIGVSGSPIILIGWTDKVAWGMTALGADQADQFMLKTDAEHPNQYYFDGEWRDMKVREETIKIKNGRPKTITLKDTHLGPVVTSIAHDTRRGEEVALKRVPHCELNRETIQGAIAMYRADDVYSFSKALHDWRFPSANIVFGDSKGNIAYSVLGAIPMRSPLALEGGHATHDGSASKYDWLGFMPYEYLPHCINPERGYLLSANHRPIASFYPSLLGISTGSSGDSDRSWRLRELLQAKDTFSPEDVLDVHYDCVSAPKREIVRLGYHMRDTLKASLSNNALRTLDYLENWYEKGACSNMAVKGSEVVNLISTFFRLASTELAFKHGGGNSGLSHFLKSTQKRLQNDPKTKLSDLEKKWIDDTLASAWQSAINRYGRNSEDWHEEAIRQHKNRVLGYFVSLDGFPSLDKEHDLTMPYLSCIDGGTIKSQVAQSYTQWVPMHDVDTAKSILPIGQSEHPSSPYYTSTYQMWSDGELHPAPLSREVVEKYVKAKKVLSN